MFTEICFLHKQTDRHTVTPVYTDIKGGEGCPELSTRLVMVSLTKSKVGREGNCLFHAASSAVEVPHESLIF